ncbi:MAG: hypothetical protein ACRD3W_15340, partial [Terriglobales bacterium]
MGEIYYDREGEQSSFTAGINFNEAARLSQSVHSLFKSADRSGPQESTVVLNFGHPADLYGGDIYADINASMIPPAVSNQTKVTEQHSEKNAQQTPEAAQPAGVIREQPNQDVDAQATATAQAAERIAQQPMDMQFQILGTALLAGIDQYAHDKNERVWGRLIGGVQGTGEVLANLAKVADFAAYCIIDDRDRAGKMGQEFGTALGQTIVGGVSLWQTADRYLYNIGFTGDYGKPFRDIVSLGQKLDEHWSQLPPREQERIKSKFITEMTADTIITAGGVAAIKKATKFTEILDTVAVEANNLHVTTKAAAKRTVNAIKGALDELVQPVGDAGTPFKIPVPIDGRKLEDYSLKMVGRAGEYVPERKPLFLAPGKNKVLNERELEAFGGVQKLENMSDGELAAVGLKRYEMPKLKLDS